MGTSLRGSSRLPGEQDPRCRGPTVSGDPGRRYSQWRTRMNTRTAQPQVGITPNMFGIPYGLAGLATCWGYAAMLRLAPASVVEVLFLVTAAVWLVLVVGYLSQVPR